MNEDSLRLIRPGLPQSGDPRKPAFFLVILMLLSISNPVAADSSISRDDFDVIDALMETLADRIQGGEPDVALSSAEGALAQVDANARGITATDPLSVSSSFLDGTSMRDSSSFEQDHPRPYEFLMDASTQPEGFPNNLFQTLFSVSNLDLNNILAIGSIPMQYTLISRQEITDLPTKLGNRAPSLENFLLTDRLFCLPIISTLMAMEKMTYRLH